MHKRGEHFNYALLAIVISIAIVSLAFLTEDNDLTGFVVSEEQNLAISPNLLAFGDVNSLRTLGPGNYYIDSNGIVYWTEDEFIAIAKVNSLGESQKNRRIYIDNQGNVGYLLE